MVLNVPRHFEWDERLPDTDRARVAKLNESLDRLNELRAVEINVAGPFARSKLAWKLATYQHALLHRIVALTDGAAIAWNNKTTLTAILSARALMETIAAMSHFEECVTHLFEKEDIEGLDAYAGRGVFASRDEEWLQDHPSTKAVNAQTFVDRFDKKLEGFKGHYDILSERAHPNSLGHNFMFSKLDRTSGSVAYVDERESERNGQMIFAALFTLPLTESMMARLDQVIVKIAEMHHGLSPSPLIEDGEVREPKKG